jgi:uncharacterized membrane protein
MQLVSNNIALILLSSLFHSFWNILTQTSKNSQCFSALKGVWILILALAYFLYNGSPLYIGQELYVWALFSGVLHGLYILSLSRAYSTEDISYVYPIARSAPVFVPLLAWIFLDEILNQVIYLAIGLIVTAIYILHFEGKLVQGVKRLLDALLHKNLRWAFITLGLVVSYSLVDKKAMDKFLFYFPDQPFTNGVTFFFLEASIGFTLCNIFVFKNSSRNEIFKSWSNDWLKALFAAIATFASYGLICFVLQFEKLSAVVSLRQISVLMVVYWGCWKLKEPFGKQRILAGFLIFIGISLISLSNSE